MKRRYQGIFFPLVFITAVFMLCGCRLLADESDEIYQAARIMCDIDSAINLYAMESEDDLQQSLYDFSDIFSDEAYADMGDLTDTYEQIRSYFEEQPKTYDLEKATLEENILKAAYKLTCEDESVRYIYFVADISDSFHKRGVRSLHIANDKETAMKDGEAEYRICLDGVDIAEHTSQDAILLREEPIVYENEMDFEMDFVGGDADGLIKEVSDEFVKYLKEKDAAQIKNMFSGSVWRYDTQMDSGIGTLLAEYADLEIESYKVSFSAESGSTSYGDISTGDGEYSTLGHGDYEVSFTVELQTSKGEKEIDLQVVSEYEPNPGRVGLTGVRTEQMEVGLGFDL